MLSPDTLHHQEEVNSALDRQIRQDIQDMAQEAQIQAQIIAHEGSEFVYLWFVLFLQMTDFSLQTSICSSNTSNYVMS